MCAAWRLLDAKYWGVPQRRKRIYLVGSFGSDSAAEILFKPDCVRRYLAKSGTQTQGITARSESGASASGIVFDARGNGDGMTVPTITGDHCERVNDYCPVVISPNVQKDTIGVDTHNFQLTGNVARTLIAKHQDHTGVPCVIQNASGFHGQNSITAAGVELHTEEAPTLTAKKQADVLYAQGFPLGFRPENTKLYEEQATTLCNGTRPGYCNGVVYSLQGSMIGREDKNGLNGDGVNENISFTLNTTDRHGVVYAIDRASFNQGVNALYDFEITDSGINSTVVAKGPAAVAYELFLEWIIRRLTPLECERLQGFPDFWTTLRKYEELPDDLYEEMLSAYMLDKAIKGQTVKNTPNKKQLTKWFNKLDCDGTRYKQTGNSLAIPCALRVIGGIADYIREGAAKNG